MTGLNLIKLPDPDPSHRVGKNSIFIKYKFDKKIQSEWYGFKRRAK
jgi:hypothetical protein